MTTDPCYTKSFAIVGFTWRADTYCPTHEPFKTHPEANEPHPIFADTEWDYQPVCTVTDCQAELEVTVLQKARCPNCGELISRYGCHPKHGCRCSGADCDRPALENLYQCAECIIDRYRPDTPN